ncbi:MAG TPA: sulfotransferase [Stellaceae bacterium]|nr:sulfotransferase [Stellaceae bacterium]
MFHGNTQLGDANGAYTAEIAMGWAREEAGLHDFDDAGLVVPLHELITRVLSDLSFTPAGLFNFKATIHRFLLNRLRLQRDLAAYPEILEEDVSDPIIILGMPRTGTTVLQRKMSADPQMQKLSLWRLLNPAPFDGEVPGDPAGRFAFARLVEDATRANPDFTISHETAADEADEDSYLLLLSFDYMMLHNIFPSPSLLEWLRSRPRQPPHLLERKLLQYLQWQDGGRRGRRWVLKNPGAVGHLKALHQTFPKATFVHSHRDMTEVMPSYCRLMEAIYQALLEPRDLHFHGREALDYWGHEIACYVRDRAELGDTINIIDLPYLDLVRDPIPTIKRVYAQAGLAYTAKSESAIKAWTAQNPQHKHGKADYSLERYGLTAQMIADAFRDATA